MEQYLIYQENVIQSIQQELDEVVKDKETELEQLQEAKMKLAKENLNLKTRLISIEKAMEHFNDQVIDV